MGYSIVKCPACGAIQATASRKELKCKLCGKTSEMWEKGARVVIFYGEVDSARKAGEIVRKLKAARA